jgi:DNA-binding NarL/FixJ family response regulator
VLNELALHKGFEAAPKVRKNRFKCSATTVVLRLMALGLGNKEIAARLDISEHTAKFHVSSILAKLGAASRMEAVTIGMTLGLVAI